MLTEKECNTTFSGIIEKDKIIEKIRTLPSLVDLEDKKLRDLMGISKVVHFQPSEIILDEDDNDGDGWIYYLISGKVSIEKKGKELISLQRTGDVFGSMDFIDNSLKCASVVALRTTTCLAVEFSRIEGLPKADRFAFCYILFRGFAEVLAKYLRITSKKYLKAKDKIAKLESKLKEDAPMR